MRAYLKYVDRLVGFASSARSLQCDRETTDRIVMALNGEPSSEFRRLVSLRARKKVGAFFTNPQLSRRAIGLLIPERDSRCLILDPACGIGDLLIAYTAYLPSARNLAETLAMWSKRLSGFDLQGEFIQMAKARLLLAAIRAQGRCRGRSIPDLDELFPAIYLADAYVQDDAIRKSSHIIMNPPFGQSEAPEDCCWGEGKVSSAALFVDSVVSRAKQGTQIVAILPEVLRVGKRYEEWRNQLLTKAVVKSSTIVGQFDAWTDIDVFLMKLEVRKGTSRMGRWGIPKTPERHNTVGDLFDVSVGPVVPYRDHRKGPDHRYIHPRLLPPWTTAIRTNERRRYSKTVFTPPFVAIRRTSRPGDKYRAIGTVIGGKTTVAVENHLLVLVPRDRSLKRCAQLLRILRNKKTSDWLDKRIRCRHLTVSSVRDLPWWKE